MRPKSYDDSPPLRSCCTCKHSHLVAYKLHLLCFHADEIGVTGHCEYPVRSDFIQMNGDYVELMEGDEYARVWASRIVDPDATCQEWEADE